MNGIVLRIGATFFFTMMVVCVKFLSNDIPLGQIVFFRSAVALIPLIIFLMWTGDFPSGLATKRPFAHVLRCLLGCSALFLSFASLRYLPLAHASMIGYLAPAFAVILAWLILGEKVTRYRWASVGLGLLGMAILIAPKLGGTAFNQTYALGAGLAFAMAIMTAGAKIQIRSLAKTENAGAIALYFALTCAIAGGLTSFLGWAAPTQTQLAWLIGAGLSGGIAHIMMTLALQQAEVSKLAPFEYLSLIFAVCADAVLFGVIPDLNFYIAAGVIIFALSLSAASERRK